MSSAMSLVRANAIHMRIIKEKERILDIFAHDQDIKQRAIIKVTKRILLHGPILAEGRYWNVKAKSLGAGVYELSLVKLDE